MGRGRPVAHTWLVMRRCPELVGRDDCVARIRQEGAKARQGRGGAVLVSGEAGIGKSALARHVGELTEGASSLVLTGRCAEAASPLRPLTGIGLAAVGAGAPVDAAALAPFRPALAHLLPGLFDGATGGNDGPVSPLVLGEALLALLDPADRKCTTLVVEDLHWADSGTVDVLDHLLDRVADHRLLVIMTTRPTGDSMPQRWIERRAVVPVNLEPLPPAGVEEMVERTLGTTPRPEVLAAVLRFADGSPLLVEEILTELEDAPDTGGDVTWTASRDGRPPGVSVPATLAAAVGRRMQRLDPDLRRVLQLAALVDRDIEPGILVSLGEQRSEIDAAIDQGLEHGLLTRGGDGSVRFRHALTRSAVSDHLLPHDRVTLSRRALEAIGAPTAQPADEARLRLAARLHGHAGERDRQAALLVDLASRSVETGAASTAIQLLDEAVAADPACEHAALVIELRIRSLALRGDEEAVARLVLQLPTEDAEDRARMRRVRRARARALGGAGRWTEARDLVEESPDDPADAATTALRAVVAIECGETERAAPLAHAALHEARVQGVPAAECEALEVLGRIEREADYESALPLFTEAVRVAERHGLQLWRARALLEVGLCEATLWSLPRGFLAARTAASEAGALSLLAMVEMMLSTLYNWRHEIDDGLRHGRASLDLAQRMQLRHLEARAQLVIGANEAAAGRGGNARAAAEAAVAAAPGDPEVAALADAWVHGFSCLVDADREGAVAAFHRGFDGLLALPYRTATLPWYVWPVVATAIDDPTAPTVLAEARASAVGPAVAPMLVFADAILLGRAGDSEAAQRRFAEGRTHLQRHGQWDFGMFLIVRMIVAEAAVQDGWGDPGVWIADAEETLREVGLPAVARACRDLIRRSGLEAAARRRVEGIPAELASLGVTARETDVLALLPEGLTNAEIGERLFISPRTVKSHLEHLFDKTGRRDRQELADLARRTGLSG